MSEAYKMELPGNGVSEPDLSHGSVFFIGTATTLIRFGGFTILTDPNFLHAGDHVHLGYGLVSKRLTDPAMEIDQLPRLDLCLLSHMHGDHFDRVAAERLPKNLPIVTTPQAARDLGGKGFRRLHPLETWDTLDIHRGPVRLRITSMPGKHGPGLLNLLLPSVMGSLLEFEAEPGRVLARIYISGDTLIHEDLKEIPKRHPDIDLALLHLGGTRVVGFLVTMDDKQGVEAIRIIRPAKAIPIHFNDYGVFKSPLADFKKAVREAGLEDRVVYLAHGETFEFAIPESRQPAGWLQARE
jgi:L-ascorbate metabolism protein UlaG (beta-lactamase superfamily)